MLGDAIASKNWLLIHPLAKRHCDLWSVCTMYSEKRARSGRTLPTWLWTGRSWVACAWRRDEEQYVYYGVRHNIVKPTLSFYFDFPAVVTSDLWSVRILWVYIIYFKLTMSMKPIETEKGLRKRGETEKGLRVRAKQKRDWGRSTEPFERWSCLQAMRLRWNSPMPLVEELGYKYW